jgi:hypothetical protein
MSFEAKYPGSCNACDGRIHEGDTVRYEDDYLIHDDCPEPIDVDAPRRTERHCPDCFTYHAGECI